MLMKMLKLLLIIVLNFMLVTNVAATSPSREVKLLDSSIYILNVTQQFIYELEDFGICNTKFHDINHKITRVNYFGLNVVGSVKLTNGFLNTFQEVTLEQTPNPASIDQDLNSAYMSMKIIFSSLMGYYDYFADLTIGKLSGTVAIPMNSVYATISLTKFFKNNTIVHDVHITGGFSGRARVWDFEPSNHYTEIINKDMMFDFLSVANGTGKLWNKLLGKAIEKIPFPRLCLNC